MQSTQPTFKRIFLSSSFFFLGFYAHAKSSWGTKVAAASEAGATEINGILDGVTTLLMAISGIVFLIGITSAGFKYKQGDQQAFKNLQGVMMGSLVILIGVGLAKFYSFKLMLNQYYTHRGVNQPPYFKGFPMSSVIVLGVILLISMMVGFLIAVSIGHLLIGTVFGILLVAVTGYFSFNFLRKIGPFGYEKMLVKHFYRIDKISGGRPVFHKMKLF